MYSIAPQSLWPWAGLDPTPLWIHTPALLPYSIPQCLREILAKCFSHVCSCTVNSIFILKTFSLLILKEKLILWLRSRNHFPKWTQQVSYVSLHSSQMCSQSLDVKVGPDPSPLARLRWLVRIWTPTFKIIPPPLDWMVLIFGPSPIVSATLSLTQYTSEYVYMICSFVIVAIKFSHHQYQ